MRQARAGLPPIRISSLPAISAACRHFHDRPSTLSLHAVLRCGDCRLRRHRVVHSLDPRLARGLRVMRTATAHARPGCVFGCRRHARPGHRGRLGRGGEHRGLRSIGAGLVGYFARDLEARKWPVRSAYLGDLRARSPCGRRSEEDRSYLEELLEFQQQLGLSSSWCSRRASAASASPCSHPD